MSSKSVSISHPAIRVKHGSVSAFTHIAVTLYADVSFSFTDWTRGWAGLRAGLDTKATGKILYLCQESNPGRPVCSQTLDSLASYVVVSIAAKSVKIQLARTLIYNNTRNREPVLCFT
jgi:hypothetical protein